MINANLHSFRVAKLEILAQETLARLGDATGFFCEYRAHTFLVTNWHVVSGRNYQTNHPLHRSQALPGALNVHTHITPRPAAGGSPPSSSTVFQIPLANGVGSPCWLQHPLFGTDVDVIAIDVSSRIANCERIFRINLESELSRDTHLSVMDQAFVTGYPLSATTTPNSLPIYKSGTIASEPRVFDSIPRIYIDGKTKTGMSGSPVMVKQQQGSLNRKKRFEQVANDLGFIGIYSGRERQERSEFEAELGIIWPYKECLVPIIDAYVDGKGSVPRKITGRAS